MVSIHTPTAGSDYSANLFLPILKCFNPRPLCRERPRAIALTDINLKGFNPRPLCRERHGRLMSMIMACRFQSTPPMQGATASLLRFFGRNRSFNPRPLCRERRYQCDNGGSGHAVSIHAPYAGSDKMVLGSNQAALPGFNPRPLCRERPVTRAVIWSHTMFQSTPPMQGATKDSNPLKGVWQVSIHAPYAGSDPGD